MSLSSGSREPIRRTTLVIARTLARRLGMNITLVSETFQETGSFEIRAAAQIVSRASARFLVTASSVNFGLALAHMCRRHNKSCTVVLHSSAEPDHVETMRDLGSRVELIDLRHTNPVRRTLELTAQHPHSAIVSPSDDWMAIEGKISLGLDLAHLYCRFDTIIVPIASGGLAAGIILGLQQAGSRAFVVGAEPFATNHTSRSFRAGELITVYGNTSIAYPGKHAIRLGHMAWPILYRRLHDIVAVPDEKILEATRLLFDLANLKAEPIAALGLAAVLTEPQRFQGRSVCCVITGGNIGHEQFSRLLAEPSSTRVSEHRLPNAA